MRGLHQLFRLGLVEARNAHLQRDINREAGAIIPRANADACCNRRVGGQSDLGFASDEFQRAIKTG